MREMVQAIRAIWDCWEGNSKLNFRGDFYTHTIMNQNFNPGPNPCGIPKIYVAGFGERMVQVCGEVGDGFLVHPLNTRKFLLEYSMPALQKGLDIAGRPPIASMCRYSASRRLAKLKSSWNSREQWRGI